MSFPAAAADFLCIGDDCLAFQWIGLLEGHIDRLKRTRRCQAIHGDGRGQRFEIREPVQDPTPLHGELIWNWKSSPMKVMEEHSAAAALGISRDLFMFYTIFTCRRKANLRRRHRPLCCFFEILNHFLSSNLQGS